MTPAKEMKLKAIIEREFRKVVNDYDASVEVTFIPEDEAISVWIDGDTYICAPGSDDDAFNFECDNASPVSFDIPEDWIEVNDNEA